MSKRTIIILILAILAFGGAAFFKLAKTKNAKIVVYTPEQNDLIKSPLEFRGKARGEWFFEAQFRVRLVDEGGLVVGRSPAIAKGEWMTQDFVDFKGVIEFESTTATRGKLIFEKDNPSGLPENSESFEVPVRFK